MRVHDLSGLHGGHHEAVVIGAGMTGLLIAASLAAQGVEVLLVEKQRIGAAQSGRSHGYLHLGYAYRSAEAELLPLFARARESWAALLDGVEPQSSESVIAFADPEEGVRATEFWRAHGLPVEPVGPPPWASGYLGACYRSREQVFDFGRVLRRFGAWARALGVRMVFGCAERVRETDRGVALRIRQADGATAEMTAPVVVLASGAGTAGVLARSGLPPVVQCRHAHMLVLRGALPAVGAVLPEAVNHGLFLASRTGHPSGTTWLVSDFQSFDGSGLPSRELPGWWARSVLSVLRRAVRPEVLAGVRLLSGYSATKAGLVPGSGTVSPRLGVSLFGGRLAVVCPSKLTLAPVAAQDAVRSVGTVLGRPLAADGARLRDDWAQEADTPQAEPAYELWETELPALKEPDLLGALPDVRTLSSLYLA